MTTTKMIALMREWFGDEPSDTYIQELARQALEAGGRAGGDQRERGENMTRVTAVAEPAGTWTEADYEATVGAYAAEKMRRSIATNGAIRAALDAVAYRLPAAHDENATIRAMRDLCDERTQALAVAEHRVLELEARVKELGAAREVTYAVAERVASAYLNHASRWEKDPQWVRVDALHVALNEVFGGKS